MDINWVQFLTDPVTLASALAEATHLTTLRSLR